MTETSGCKKRPAKRMIPFLVDNAFSHFLLGPLTTLFWRGAWEFLNRNLVPDHPYLAAWICFAIGNVGLVGLAISQNLWTTHVRVEKTCSVRWLVGYHLYTYTLGILNVFHWRGVWELLDRYTGANGISCLVSLAIGQFTLWLFRCSKSLVSPPMAVDMDTDPEFFQHDGRFRAKFVMSTVGVLDSIFTVVVVHQLTVFYWRGLWEVFDVYVFPENDHASSVTCLLIAFTIHGFLCILQPVFNRLFRSAEKSRRRKAWQWLLETVIYFLGNPVPVLQWRGVWHLCNEYVNPSRSDAVDLALHFMAVGLLMLLSCGQTITVRGCPIEGDASLDDGCMFPNKYFRHFIERRDRALLLVQQQEEPLQQEINQSKQDHEVLSLVENKTHALLSNGDHLYHDKPPVVHEILIITSITSVL